MLEHPCGPSTHEMVCLNHLTQTLKLRRLQGLVQFEFSLLILQQLKSKL